MMAMKRSKIFWSMFIVSILLISILFSSVVSLASNLNINPSELTLPTPKLEVKEDSDVELKQGESIKKLIRSMESLKLDIKPVESKKETTLVFTIGDKTYLVDGKALDMDVSPTIIEDRTFLPIRFAAEPLGADVKWDPGPKKATVSLGASIIELWIGKNEALVNGKIQLIDEGNPNVKPLILNDRTMLPLRFVAESLGCDVYWDPITKEAKISKEASSDLGWLPGLDIKPGTILPDFEIKPGITLPILEIEIKKPALPIAIKDDDMKALKLTWGKEADKGKSVPVQPTEAEIPAVMRIGCGYNVFDKYASVDSLKEQVLDTRKLIDDQRMMRIYIDSLVYPSTEGRSIRDYSKSMAINAGAGGSFLCFGGSANTNFNKTRTEKSDNYFATNSLLVKKYEVYVKAPTDFKKYLTDDASSIINGNVDPNTVFATFGHFVLVDGITGGRADYSVTASSKASTSYENFSVAARASFNVLIASANASTEYQSVVNKAAFDENKLEEFSSHGGYPNLNKGHLNDIAAITNWTNSLESRGTLVDFGNKTTRALVPIWKLADTNERRIQLEFAFRKLEAAQAKNHNWPVEKYIKNFQLLSYKNVNDARRNVEPGFQLINVDMDEAVGGNYVFLAYYEDEDPNGAITDFFMEYTGSTVAAQAAMKTHNKNYLEYYCVGIDLNSRKKDDSINLWASWDPKLPPITAIDIVRNDPDKIHPDWETVCWQNTHIPANTNEGTKKDGTRIYIKFKR